MRYLKAARIIVLIFIFSGRVHSQVNQNGKNLQKLTIMTYNVENLFDAQDDKGKADETYLPLSLKRSKEHKKKCASYRFAKWRNQCLHWDWSEKFLQIKLERLGKVIAQVNEGRGPDILIFQEVENERILRRLNREKLSEMGYSEVVLIEGRDRRGIDIAMLSRLKVVGKPKLHRLSFKGFPKKRVEDTRGVLQADFQLPGERILTVFGTHFPAPFHPVEMRIQAFRELKRLKKELPKDRLVIAAGDFNVPSEEDRVKKVLDRFVKGEWLIAHRIGCKNCKGTSYYPPKKSWSFLDMILLSHNFTKGESAWKILPETVRLVNNHPVQQTAKGFPNSFKLPAASGVSDHWPLAVDIALVK